jgi:hypothetical protein
VKLLVVLSGCALLVHAPGSPAQVPATDKMTGIPLFPPVRGDDKRIPGGICRITLQTVVYLVPFQFGPNQTAAPKQIEVVDVDQWYKLHLKEFRLLEGSDGSRRQDVFLSPDGTRAVTVTGNPAPSPNAFSVSYTLFSGAIQPNQVKSFVTHQKVQC